MLVHPLLEMMTALAAPWHTFVLVVAEVRAEDVLGFFGELEPGLNWGGAYGMLVGVFWVLGGVVCCGSPQVC